MASPCDNKPDPPASKVPPTILNKCSKSAHLILVATYKGNGNEVDARNKDKWEPTTLDFAAVAKWEADNSKIGCIEVQQVANVRQWFDAIANRPANSLKTVSLITHSNAKSISLSGTVDWNKGGDQNVTVGGAQIAEDGNYDDEQVAANEKTARESTALDEALLMGSGGKGWFDNADRGCVYSRNIQRALAKDAVFKFYSCNSGSGGVFTKGALLKKIAQVFNVDTKGFDMSVWYQPVVGAKGWDRTRTGIGKDWKAAEPTMDSGIFHLDGKLKSF